MGNVASENIPEELVSEGGESSGDIIEDSIVLDLDEQVLTEPEEPPIDLDYVITSDFSEESNDLFDL